MVGHAIAGEVFLLRLGLGLTANFVLLRAINVYGDPVRWSTQKSAAFTVLSFLNTSKYPPSLLFLLMTLGPAMLFLWAVDGRTPQWLRPALVFGKVPMFYYPLHIPLIHLPRGHRMLCALWTGALDVRVADSRAISDHASAGWGFSLPIVYLVWAFVVVALYPLCRWFACLEAAPQRCPAQLLLNSDDRVRDSPLKRVGADALIHPAARSATVQRRSVATFALTLDEGVRGCLILAVTSLPSGLCSARRAIFAVGRSIPVIALASIWRCPVKTSNASGQGLLWPISSILLNFAPASFEP